MKLLVTGGAGFIGSNFVLYWLKNHPEDELVNIDKLTYAGNPENLKDAESAQGYTFVQADICDRDAVAAVMKGTDMVVHFAAESHVDRSIADPGEFVKTNVLGTQVLLECALHAEVNRFHHISTDEVFGSLDLDSEAKFTEITKYDPRSPYAATKAASDHLVRAYFHTFGLPVTISNCSNNYGPYQFPEKLIPLAITNILEGKKVPVYGTGRNVRDWLFVDDHVRGIETILKSGSIGETYAMGGMTDRISNLDIVKKITDIMGADESVIEFVADRPGHDLRYAIDWTKMKETFGWQPRHDFDTYLERTVSWYRDNPQWWQRVKSGAYRQYYERQYGSRV
jgi:dTDP-glucose 4,6-dehydratase